MGELRGIWLKRSRRGPIDPVETAELDVDRGLAGDANPGGRRQVTIIERERCVVTAGGEPWAPVFNSS